MYKICFYVPIDNVEDVKNAMFNAGAGKIGEYSNCAWQVLGEGQFIPLETSNPHIGEIFQLEKVKEYKVEMVCSDDCIEAVVAAFRETHPYEEPAFQVVRLEDY